jgi:hypothetical protein
VFRATASRESGYELRCELHGVEVPPTSFVGVISQAACAVTFRTGDRRADVLQVDFDSAILEPQVDRLNQPGVVSPEQPGVVGGKCFHPPNLSHRRSRIWQNLPRKSPKNLTTNGHSLGGGLASAASVVTGAPGITFNAAGLHTNTLRQFIGDPLALETALQRYNQANGLITALHVDFDFLTTLQVFGSLAGLPMALGTPVALDGPYDLQTGAAFVIAISFPGILGAVPLAATELQAHLMPAVLWGLLVEEGIVSPRRDTLGYDWTRFYFV